MKNNRNLLKNELMSRRNKKEDMYHVIGAEIKDRRLTLSRTLSSLSYKICSTSYLCKIENNKIIPNRVFLKEICKRLQMKEDKVETLLNLRVTLEDVVKAFIAKNQEYIRYSFEQGAGLRNYRYKIIELIYYISIKELSSANEKANELMRLVSTMVDGDLVVYSLFYGILSFYNQDLQNALEDFEALESFHRLTEEICILKKKYKFFIYIVLNHPCCIFEYTSLVQALLTSRYMHEIEEVHYIMGFYLLRNRFFSQYKKIYKLIHIKCYRKSLSLLAKLMLSPRLEIRKEWLEGVRPFFYYLGLIRTDYPRAVAEIGKLNSLSFDIDFNLLYLEYFLLSDEQEKYKYIMNVAFPTLERTPDGFAGDFFLGEMSKLSSKLCRYKAFNEAFKRLKGEAE